MIFEVLSFLINLELRHFMFFDHCHVCITFTTSLGRILFSRGLPIGCWCAICIYTIFFFIVIYLWLWSRLRITFCLRYIASYFALILVLAAAGFPNAMYIEKLFSCFILQQVPNKRYKDNISWQVHEEVTNIVPPVSLFDIFHKNHCGFHNLVLMNYSPSLGGGGTV